MPEETKSPEVKETAPQLEGGTYEIIRKRLYATGAELRGRLNKLSVYPRTRAHSVVLQRKQ